MEFNKGDIFYTVHKDQYHVFKLLALDEALDCCHVLCYEPVQALPAKDSLDQLSVMMYHTPIDRGGFSNPVWIANRPLTADDLIGYHEYIRQTQAPADYIPLASSYFNEGIRLSDEGKHAEAIEAYSKASDLVPMFYEAIDNRAFCKMDLGLWQAAIEDFHQSLEVNPVSILAEFSIGECYLNMKNYQEAKTQFEKALAIDPAHQLSKDFLQKAISML